MLDIHEARVNSPEDAEYYLKRYGFKRKPSRNSYWERRYTSRNYSCTFFIEFNVILGSSTYCFYITDHTSSKIPPSEIKDFIANTVHKTFKLRSFLVAALGNIGVAETPFDLEDQLFRVLSMSNVFINSAGAFIDSFEKGTYKPLKPVKPKVLKLAR